MISKKTGMVIFFFLITHQLFSQRNNIYKVVIKGAKKTKITFIKKLLNTKENQVLDSLVLKEDIIRLKRLPSIAHAYFQVFRSHKNNYKIFITIEENYTLIPDINIWTTTHQRTAYKLSLYEYNFLGKNITLGGFYQNNNYNSYGFLLKAPYFFSKKWGLSLNYQNWKSEEPLYFDNRTANYKYQNKSYEILALFQINFKNQVQFGVNFFREQYHYLFGYTSPNVPEHLDVKKQLFKVVYTFDDLDYSYQYINGFKSVFYGQFVKSPLKNEENFYIAWNDFFYFKRIGKKGNWANRVRFGLATNNNSPFSPFALDNNVNIRGVGVLVDRGTGTLVFNTEYRHTLIDKKRVVLQSNTFLDVGSWRKPGGTLTDFFQAKNSQINAGIGLRLIHKKIVNAVFRVDYGLGLTKYSSSGLVFGLGQYF